MELINQLAEQYAVSFSSPEDALTGEVSAFTTQTHTHAERSRTGQFFNNIK